VFIIFEFVLDGVQNGFDSRNRVRSSTIKTNLCSIRHFFAATGLEFPFDHPQVRMLLKGINRTDAPSRRKSPVSVALMERCSAELDLQDPADQALLGVLCLAFFFLLRRSEIVSTTNTSFQWFALHVADITTADEPGAVTMDPSSASSDCIRLRGWKTNQGGASVLRMLGGGSGHPRICPVLLKCVTAARVSRAVQQAAIAGGEDASSYSAHSLRSGGATNMYCAGVDALTIQF
jgi:hypothetical protein